MKDDDQGRWVRRRRWGGTALEKNYGVVGIAFYMHNACHHLAAESLGYRQKLTEGGSGEWPCWIVQSGDDRNKTGYLAGNSFAE